MKCQCGRAAQIGNLCKACYMVKWRQRNPTYNREHQRLFRAKEYAKPKDALGIFCAALDCEPKDFAHHILVLRGEAK